MSKRRWLLAPPAPVSFIARFPEFPPLVAQIFYNRGVHTLAHAQQFVNGIDESDPVQLGQDPFQLRGMNQAVERIRRAIRDGEAIAVYGDFDADGVCATALLTQALKTLGAKAMPYIPHRINEGYGLNEEALKELKDKGVRVVVTVDCGIRSLNEVEAGTTLGLDMIVTDHHSVGKHLPNAISVINPKQVGEEYPFQEFAGVGIAFKVAQALARKQIDEPLPNASALDLDELLDLVALGTVADLVPLLGENRTLVKRGLARLNKTDRPGLVALLQQAGARNRTIDAGTIGYFLGPRLNAAGRIEHARTAYTLLSTYYPGEADALASQLETINRERQKLTDEMVMRAREMVALLPPGEFLLIAGSPDFPEGIIGLIASKLQEDAYRPAIAMSHREGVMRGSARSIPEFNIVAALDECSDLLVRHGGHAAAAGFTVKSDNFSALHTRLRDIAARDLAQLELTPTISVDAEADLTEMNWNLLQHLERLAPFGYGNREPVFLSRNVIVRAARVVGTDHLSLVLSDGIVVWDAIAFRHKDMFPLLNPPPKQVDIVYTLTSKVWGGEPRLQLEIKDLRLSDGG
ncbi:MAG TPA: single-stranded-DNA-specific exonuclease RecJ [Anaerolineae bacterium]|nr:single-stranded-DNA-specific exonuclease RecJ [Anaerolineae bacterium]